MKKSIHQNLISHLSDLTSHLVLFVCLVALSQTCSAQTFKQLINPFAVTSNNAQLVNPFSGGVMQPRITLADADGDGLPDLFTLNPDNHLRLYHNAFTTVDGVSFVRVFPTLYDSLPIRSWFRLTDIDGDGRVDMLTSGQASEILIYKNIGSVNAPQFSKQQDTLRAKDNLTITTQQETVPSFVDIDSDGDLDFFTGNPEGSITFYENIGTPTAYQYVFRKQRYMEILVVSPLARKDGGARIESTKLHGASVLTFADMDGDGDLDILFGDFFTKRLLLFHNDGRADSAAFSMSRIDTAFGPVGDVVSTDGFNQAETGDVDGDGDMDVIVASLLPSPTLPPLMYFKNIQSTTSPRFVEVALRVTSEIDVGTFAAPTRLKDATHDGVLVGSSDGALTYYAFTYTDGGKTLKWTEGAHFRIDNHSQVSPTSGDLIGDDGIAEVVVGYDDGGLLCYTFDGTSLVRVPWQLDTAMLGRNTSPCLADIDDDGDLDLLVGTGGGRFVYFTNVGTKSVPVFQRTPAPTPFDTLDVDNDATPRFFDVDGDHRLDCIVGTRRTIQQNVRQDYDSVLFYLNKGDGTYGPSSKYPPIAAALNPVPMMLAAPTANYLIIGSMLGGMVAFIDSNSIVGVREYGRRITEMKLLPNIVTAQQPYVSVRMPIGHACSEVTVVDAIGRVVLQRVFNYKLAAQTIQLPNSLASGTYSVCATDGQFVSAGKLIVIR